MEIEIDQGRFLSALSLVQTVADRRNTMPILSNILLQATASDELICCATDMMVSMAERVPCKVALPGSLTLNARRLYSVIRTLPKGDFRIKGLDNFWAKISANRSEFRLMGLPEADFPWLPDSSGVTFTEVQGHRIVDLIEKTIFSVASDEARININGALFKSNEETMTIISTDGHRLTKYSIPLSIPNLGPGIIVPRKGMEEIRRTLNRINGSCFLGFSDEYLFIHADTLKLSVKLNNATFPPWEKVIPKGSKNRAVVNRENFISSLRQTVAIASEGTATVKVNLDRGCLRLSANNAECGAIELELNVDYDGDSLSTGFNANYLIEALSAIESGNIYFDFQGEFDPCTLSPSHSGGQRPDFTAVVMPVRV